MSAKKSVHLRIIGFLLPAITLFSVASTAYAFSEYLNPMIFTFSATLFFVSSAMTYFSAAFLSEGKEEKASILLILAPLFYIAASFIYELGLYRVRNYNYMFSFLPDIIMSIAPISIYYASLDRLCLKKSGGHSVLWLCISLLSIVFLIAGAFYYSYSFSYVYMSVASFKTYSVLSISFAFLLSAASVSILVRKRGSGISPSVYFLLILSMSAEFAMNLMEYDEGRLYGAMLNGQLSGLYPASSIVSAWLFIFFASFSASAIFSEIILLFTLTGNEKKRRIRKKAVPRGATAFERTDEERKTVHLDPVPAYEIPPNVPKKKAELPNS